MAINSVLTIFPQNQWQTITVSFSDFDLASGDALNVYEGTSTTFENQIANMTGTGVSQANGGWVTSNCDPTINSTGCLTFQFRTNGDNNKGRGWAANIACNDRGIELAATFNNGKIECHNARAWMGFGNPVVTSTCGKSDLGDPVVCFQLRLSLIHI